MIEELTREVLLDLIEHEALAGSEWVYKGKKTRYIITGYNQMKNDVFILYRRLTANKEGSFDEGTIHRVTFFQKFELVKPV